MSVRYEQSLRDIYALVTVVWSEHDQHPLFDNTCKVDDQCDALTDAIWRVVIDAFPQADAKSWLMDGPLDLLDWSTGGEMVYDTPREAIAACLRRDADLRIKRRDAPGVVDPATTYNGDPCEWCENPRLWTPCEHCASEQEHP